MKTMKIVLCLLSLFLFSSAMSFAQDALTTEQRPLAFTHVTVIDATGAPAQPDMTVVVSGNHIVALGKASAVMVPANAAVTNATGKFMIPGLWEMHQHTFTEKNKLLPLYVMWLDIVNGITGVRDMGDHGTPTADDDRPFFDNFEWRQAVAAGSVIAPRLVLPGALLEGSPSRRKGWIEIANAAQGREAVDFLTRWGVDFIKVHNNLSRESYFAVAEEAKKQGMVFAGHVTNTVSVAEASDAGQKSLEHLQGILVGCSTQEPEMMRAIQAEGVEHALVTHGKEILATYSDAKCKALFAKFVKNNTYICPTLIRERLAPYSMTDPGMEYLSATIREDIAGPTNRFKQEDLPVLKMLHAAHYRVVKEMQETGVKLLVGTDARIYGYDTHNEMAEMVAAGLTPMQVLQAATKNPAEFFGKLDLMGTIEKGKIADLVLLDANPLESIGNASKISSVVLNGLLLDRNALDHMQAQIKFGANTKVKPAVGYNDLK
jgi:imidazolonepropionase-like amidohydrolase